MAALITFDCFAGDLIAGTHNFGAHSFKYALTNSLPDVAADTDLTDLTEVDYTYLTGTRAITIASVSESSGITMIAVGAISDAASGGSVGPFRWFVIYNDSISPKRLVGYLALASAQSVADGKNLVLAAGNILSAQQV